MDRRHKTFGKRMFTLARLLDNIEITEIEHPLHKGVDIFVFTDKNSNWDYYYSPEKSDVSYTAYNYLVGYASRKYLKEEDIKNKKPDEIYEMLVQNVTKRIKMALSLIASRANKLDIEEALQFLNVDTKTYNTDEKKVKYLHQLLEDLEPDHLPL